MGTEVEVWENQNCCTNTSRGRVFSQLFLSNFHELFDNRKETLRKCFQWFLEDTCIYQNVNPLCSLGLYMYMASRLIARSNSKENLLFNIFSKTKREHLSVFLSSFCTILLAQTNANVAIWLADFLRCHWPKLITFYDLAPTLPWPRATIRR
jgi:hypothetical protein